MSGHTVWLASYPKSGNTWFRAVFAAWRRDDPFALDAADPIASLRHRFDDALGLYSSDLTDDEALALRPTADDIVDGAHAEPHLHKIHDALLSGAGDGLAVSSAATRCAIYLVRDPRDVAVSFAHHNDRDPAWATQRICSPGSRIDGRSGDIAVQFPQQVGDWSAHVHGWVDEAPFPVHVVRYEDCVADPMRTFADAFAFAGFTITEDELVAALDAASFARLQERERATGFGERWGRAPFFRRGIAGGWRDELKPELAERIEQAHGVTMERFGYHTTRCAEVASSSADSTEPA